jgi:hypothetical protein
MRRTLPPPPAPLTSHSMSSHDQHWVHPLCVLYTPELTLNPDQQMKPNEITILDPDREELVCEICHKSGGSNVQCADDDCYLSFHPYCGFLTHRQMVIRSVVVGASSRESQVEEAGEGEEYQFHYEVYCEKHKRRIRNQENIVSSTVELVKGCSVAQQKRDQDTSHRRNSSPFHPSPPAASTAAPLEESWIQESDEKKNKKRRRCVASLPPPPHPS